MIKKLASKTENAFELKGGINGLKMILGATLVVLAAQIPALDQLCTDIPALCDYTKPAIAFIGMAVEWIKFVLANAGQLLLWGGALFKVVKFFKG